MFSPRLLTTPQRSATLGRYLVYAKLCDLNEGTAAFQAAVAHEFGSNPSLRIEPGGQSDRVTPEPFPNSEDKPVRVPCCTQMRELSGNMDRCHAHLIYFNFNLNLSSLITTITLQLSNAARSTGNLCARKGQKCRALPYSPRYLLCLEIGLPMTPLRCT